MKNSYFLLYIIKHTLTHVRIQHNNSISSVYRPCYRRILGAAYTYVSDLSIYIPYIPIYIYMDVLIYIGI